MAMETFKDSAEIRAMKTTTTVLVECHQNEATNDSQIPQPSNSENAAAEDEDDGSVVVWMENTRKIIKFLIILTFLTIFYPILIHLDLAITLFYFSFYFALFSFLFIAIFQYNFAMGIFPFPHIFDHLSFIHSGNAICSRGKQILYIFSYFYHLFYSIYFFTT